MKKKLLVYLMCIALVFAAIIVSGCEEVTVEAITITSANGATEIEAGKTLQLSARVTPPQASQKVTWSSNHPETATVDGNGLVTAISAGNVIITATSVADNKISKTFALIIKTSQTTDNTPKTVALSTANNVTTVKVGETLKITATVSPAAASQEVVWETSDGTVATVNNGVVTGVKEGSAIITATAKDVSTVKNSITITVSTDSATNPKEEYESLSYSTHDEYMAMENDTPIKIKGVVTYIVPSDSEISYYIQNGADAFYVFKQDAGKFPVEVGKVYEVGGVKTLYRTGAHEIKDVVYCDELTESISFTATSLDDKDPSSQEDMNPYHGAVVSGTATVSAVPAIGSKAYSVNVTVNGKDTTLRIDPANMSSAEFTQINEKLSAALAGTEISFTGVLTHYGNGNYKAPQMLIFKASDLTVAEATPEQKVAMVKDSLTVKAFVAQDESTIKLDTTSEAFDDVTITWACSAAEIITSAGVVTHPANDTVVTLTATITHNTEATATDTREFKVNVAGSAFAGEKLAALDFEDASTEDLKYGVSPTKSSYTLKDENGNVTDEANTVTLGEKDWILTGTLISTAAGNDHCDGQLAGRMSSKEGKVQTTAAGEYNYVQFDAAIYNNQALGTCIAVMYQMEGSEEWVESGFIVTVDSYELTTYRIALEQGAKNIRICVVSGTGNVNIDNIELYK